MVSADSIVSSVCKQLRGEITNQQVSATEVIVANLAYFSA
jgi:hypothetical protein